MNIDNILRHYQSALQETQQAARSAAEGDYENARAALARRSKVTLQINAGCRAAPDWGRHDELDALALALIKADRALESLLRFA